jgi:hypothetical protein
VLARQLLLERSALPLERVLEQVAGLQTQYAPSGYIGLWSRVADFRRPMLTRALEERRAIQATLMRITIHTVSAADFWPMARAVGPARRAWWLRLNRGFDAGQMERYAGRLRSAIGGDAVHESELKIRMAAAGIPDGARSGIGLWIDLVRVPPSGTWERRRANVHGLAEAWLPRPLDAPDEAAALAHLVRRYLGGFGPAAVRDIADWAAVPVTQVRAALAGVPILRFRDEEGRELVDIEGAPLPPADSPAPVRFIGHWEALLLVHARRTQILPETYRPRIFHTRAPHSFATFLVDGQVAGTWRHEAGEVKLEPFAPLARAALREIEEEAGRLALLFAD